jgi:hypothetical protein
VLAELCCQGDECGTGSGGGDGCNWHEWFGSQLPKGKEMVVQWVEVRKKKLVYENFLGELAGDFDSMSSSHLVNYPVAEANAELHTASNLKADKHWMNLATMEIDFASDSSSVSNNGCTSSSYFSFWVDANFIKLPFIESTLFPDGVHVGKCESATRRKAKAQAKGTENAPTNQVNPQCPVWPGQLT